MIVHLQLCNSTTAKTSFMGGSAMQRLFCLTTRSYLLALPTFIVDFHRIDQWALFFSKADCLRKQGQQYLHEAQSFAEQALALLGPTVAIVNTLANLQHLRGDPEAAINTYMKCLLPDAGSALAPNDHVSLMGNIAMCYHSLGKSEDAAKWVLRALGIAQKAAGLTVLKAKVQVQVQRYRKCNRGACLRCFVRRNE